MINNSKLRIDRKSGRFNSTMPFSSDLSTIRAIIMIVGFICAVFMFVGCACASEVVNMVIIAEIESGNDPSAYNSGSGATGMYQITQVVIDDYRANKDGFQGDFSLREMYNEHYAYFVANWYMNARIPYLLARFHIADTVRNRLWAYNGGIGMVKRGVMRRETRNYIKKYFRLLQARKD